MVWPSSRPVRRCSSRASSSSVGVNNCSSTSKAPSCRQGNIATAAELSTDVLIGTKGLVAQALSAGDDADRPQENLKVVAHKRPASKPAAAFCICEVEVGIPLPRALRDLSGPGQAGGELVPIGQTLGPLPFDELGRPGPRSDQADVSAEDVPELRHLVHVPRLQQAPADPGQIC